MMRGWRLWCGRRISGWPGPAEPASRPYKPNLPLNLTIGALGGLVLAIGYVMLREQNTSRLHAPGEAGSYLAVPELGAIPNDGAWKPTVAGLLHPGNGRLAGGKGRAGTADVALIGVVPVHAGLDTLGGR